MSAPLHNFNCPACLHCLNCSRSMQELHERYVVCTGGAPHFHLGMQRGAGEPFEPYVPEWAEPLEAARR